MNSLIKAAGHVCAGPYSLSAARLQAEVTSDRQHTCTSAGRSWSTADHRSFSYSSFSVRWSIHRCWKTSVAELSLMATGSFEQHPSLQSQTAPSEDDLHLAMKSHHVGCEAGSVSVYSPDAVCSLFFFFPQTLAVREATQICCNAWTPCVVNVHAH